MGCGVGGPPNAKTIFNKKSMKGLGHLYLLVFVLPILMDRWL
jgi:hypothetical protein